MKRRRTNGRGFTAHLTPQRAVRRQLDKTITQETSDWVWVTTLQAQQVEREAVRILGTAVYLGEKHGVEASRETVRQWMMRGKLWRGKKANVKDVHMWRPRRSRFGEATSRLFARFVRSDSTVPSQDRRENWRELVASCVASLSQVLRACQPCGR